MWQYVEFTATTGVAYMFLWTKSQFIQNMTCFLFDLKLLFEPNADLSIISTHRIILNKI